MPQAPAAPHSQTLARGIRVLEVLADSDGPLSIAELAAALGVHRSIVYRILRTLEDHGLVLRDSAGAASIGPRMASLARGVERDLTSASLNELTAAANDLGMTAFLVVLDHLECVTLLSVEPRAGAATVAQRPGTRHSLAVGAPGLALQSLLSDDQLRAHGGVQRRHDAGAVGEHGYATSQDEVIPGLRSIAVPLSATGSLPASVAVVYVASDTPDEAIGERLIATRNAIALALR